VTELGDERWLWYLALLCDVSRHIRRNGNVGEETHEVNAE